MTNTVETKLSDEKIIELAQKIDKFLIDTGIEYETTGIELAAIALGRLMVFTQQVGQYDTFHQMLSTIAKMGEMPETPEQ